GRGRTRAGRFAPEGRTVSKDVRRMNGLGAWAPWAIAAILGLGWAAREAASAAGRAAPVRSETVTLDKVLMKDFLYEGKKVGRIGLYTEGETPASTKFVAGRFVLA